MGFGNVLPDNILSKMDAKDRAPLGKAGKTRNEVVQIQLAKREKEVQADVSNLLRLRGIFFSSPRMDKRSTVCVGTPDFLFAYQGKPVAFECKAPKGKLSEDQIRVHQKMRENGWAVFEIRDVSDAKAALDLISSSTKTEASSV